jgi:threonylcarbamoyladenosine tRNA methylthiotransferase MtaB
MNFAVVTFGCRVNQADSMEIERDLRTRGGRATAPADADLIVVNSCSVTATADQGTRQTIRRIGRDNPHAKIVVTGCYATRCPDELAALPNVVAVIGNDRKDELVERELATSERYAGNTGPCGADDLSAPYLLDRTAFTLRVQTGCEEQCSYCIIPTTRGRQRSKAVDDIVGDLQRAESSGFREVTLTGVHLGGYGRDLTPSMSLAALLDRVVSATHDILIRLGSLEPMDVPPTLAGLAESGRLAPAFHLPLQHASDVVLARMRRPYTLDQYRRTVDSLRERLPHASIGSDIIVGFPGETDRDIEQLCEYLESSPLTALHVFPYSDRPGTEATSMTEKVPPPAIRERGRRVREIGERLTAQFRRSQVGGVRPALTIEDGSVAVTDNGLKVRLDPPRARNERVRIEILDTGTGRIRS